MLVDIYLNHNGSSDIHARLSLCPYLEAVDISLPMALGISLRLVKPARVATGIYIRDVEYITETHACYI